MQNICGAGNGFSSTAALFMVRLLILVLVFLMMRMHLPLVVEQVVGLAGCRCPRAPYLFHEEFLSFPALAPGASSRGAEGSRYSPSHHHHRDPVYMELHEFLDLEDKGKSCLGLLFKTKKVENAQQIGRMLSHIG